PVPGLEVVAQLLARRPQPALLVAQVARWLGVPLQFFFAGDPPDTVRGVISVDEDSARQPLGPVCHAVSLLAAADVLGRDRDGVWRSAGADRRFCGVRGGLDRGDGA